MASRRPWMPWLCDRTRTPSSSQTASPALGAIEAWTRNGREYDASTSVVPEPGAPASSRTGTSSWVPDLSQVERSSASGRRSRSSQTTSSASRASARSTSASRSPTTPTNEPSRTSLTPGALHPSGTERSAAPTEGGRRTRPWSIPSGLRSARKPGPAEHLVGQVRPWRAPPDVHGTTGRKRLDGREVDRRGRGRRCARRTPRTATSGRPSPAPRRRRGPVRGLSAGPRGCPP